MTDEPTEVPRSRIGNQPTPSLNPTTLTRTNEGKISMPQQRSPQQPNQPLWQQPQWQQPQWQQPPPPPPSAKRKLREWRLMIALGIVLVAVLWFRACGAVLDVLGGDDTSTTQDEQSTAPPPTPTALPSASADSVLYAAYQLRVGEPVPDGYERSLFGQKWADVDRNGCDQRNDVLRRDLRKRHAKPGTNGCVLARGVLKSSPYSGDRIKD